MFKQYENLYKKIKIYFNHYGGFNVLLKSPFFLFSLIFTLILFPIWNNLNWWDLPITILPGFLGFSLTAYIFFLAFGNERLINVLIKKKQETSLYLKINASFIHFLIVQMLAILFAILFKYLSELSNNEYIGIVKKVCSLQEVSFFQKLTIFGWGFGFFLYIYSLFLIFSIIFFLFDLVLWYHESINVENDEKYLNEIIDNSTNIKETIKVVKNYMSSNTYKNEENIEKYLKRKKILKIVLTD